MTRVTTDIDIDFADRDLALYGIMHIPASREKDGERFKHITSVYFQDIPCDPLTGIATIPYKESADLGYFKIDFLNNSIYRGVRDEEHLDRLLNDEPDWSLLEEPGIVSMLPHIGSHFGIVQRIRPTSIEDLAVVLALIRPGKRHLSIMPRSVIDAEVWQASDQYTFKRAHAIAYAASIVVQINLLVEQTAEQLQETLA